MVIMMYENMIEGEERVGNEHSKWGCRFLQFLVEGIPLRGDQSFVVCAVSR